jgi:hypothetical protein
MPIMAGRRDQARLLATNRSKITLKRIPARKSAIAKTRLEKVSQSARATLIAVKTRLPVTCPVKVLARRNPAASAYPPIKASPRESHALLRRCSDVTVASPSGLGPCGLYAATQYEQTITRFQGRGAYSRSSELPIASAELPDLQLPATSCPTICFGSMISSNRVSSM